MLRLARVILLAGLTLGAASAAPSWAAARPMESHATYTNATYSYTINYPGNWKKSSSKTVQFIAFSPDDTAFLTANAVKGTLSMSDIKTAQKHAISAIGALQGKISYALKAIHGLPYELAEALVQNAHRKVLDVVLVDTDQKGVLYDFDAGVVTGLSVSSKEITALQNALNSIVITVK